MQIRLSLGSAVHLGLREARMEAIPTTLYTLLGETCAGDCLFCAQARSNAVNRKFLSRIVWPPFDLEEVLPALALVEGIGRLCIQTLLDPQVQPDLLTLVPQIRRATVLPISVCMNPMPRSYLEALKDAGVERVGVGLDAATCETFEVIKPGFCWETYLRFLEDTVDVFGHGSVHLIVGLGDADETLIRSFQRFHDAGCDVALFALTPMRGARLRHPPPELSRYRALQLARHLIVKRLATVDAMHFDDERLVDIGIDAGVLARVLDNGSPFRTSGCPGCNRPLYNERPGGAMYNYPQPPTEEEKGRIRRELRDYGLANVKRENEAREDVKRET